MSGFLGFCCGSRSVDWECPECGRKIPVAGAADASRWKKCEICKDLERLEELVIKGFNDYQFNKKLEDKIIEMIEGKNGQCESIDLILMLTEECYGSGKAMQVADILRGE